MSHRRDKGRRSRLQEGRLGPSRDTSRFQDALPSSTYDRRSVRLLNPSRTNSLAELPTARTAFARLLSLAEAISPSLAPLRQRSEAPLRRPGPSLTPGGRIQFAGSGPSPSRAIPRRTSPVPLSALGMRVPGRVAFCVRRKMRREVLHALRLTGRGHGGGARRRTEESNYHC